MSTWDGMQTSSDLRKAVVNNHGGNGSEGQNGYKEAIDRLKLRLSEDRITRLALSFIDRFEGVHLKDLRVDGMDEHRRMQVGEHTLVNFGSDSFLGLDQDPQVQRALVEALEEWGTHNGASRAFSSVALCEQAEQRLAEWLGVEDTLIFPSVTLANVGLLPALACKGDLLVVDRKSHDSLQQASLIAAGNGARLVQLNPCSGQALRTILESEDYEHAVIAVDGIYSMTGEIAPLDELYEVANEFEAVMYVDDAHATGMVGPCGRGTASMLLGSLNNILMVGSLSKAFSCMGAFVTCDSRLKKILKIRSSTFIFGGPVPPPYLAGICAVCDILQSPEHEAMIRHMRALIERLVRGVETIGLPVSGGEAGIVSVTIGDIEPTLRAGKMLFDRGYYAQSATYPAVPIMSGLLRIQVNANHTTEDIDGLIAALGGMRDELGLAESRS